VLESSNFFDWDGNLIDYETTLNYRVTLRTQDVFNVSGGAAFVKLLRPFDPSNSGRPPLATGTEHRWNFWGTRFTSRPQRTFRYGYSTQYGGYYGNGTRFNATGTVSYRFQPYVSIAGMRPITISGFPSHRDAPTSG
jgi:hypothetical protein